MTGIRDEHSQRMRSVSGSVDDPRRLVCFLYLLARNHLPVGTIESIWKTEGASVEGPFEFTNGWLATWAQNMAERLGAPPISDKLVETPYYSAQAFRDASFSPELEQRMKDEMLGPHPRLIIQEPSHHWEAVEPEDHNG